MDICIITVNNDLKIYGRCISNNKHLASDKIKKVRIDNQPNLSIALRYNEFLNTYNFSQQAWLVFCHNDFEVLEDLTPILRELDRNFIYGPIGVALYANNMRYQMEWAGSIYEKKRDGSNPRYIKGYRTLTGTNVDALDECCIIVHSSLIANYNLRFDENYDFDCYGFDFCISAYLNYNIQTKIVSFRACHWNQYNSIDDRKSYGRNAAYFQKKFKDSNLNLLTYLPNQNVDFHLPNFISVGDNVVIGENYHSDINLNNKNEARVIAYNFIQNNSVVLDVGCADGDLGKLLHNTKNCLVTGMEYSLNSLKYAAQTNSFERLHNVDLNNLDINDYIDYENNFDYVVFGDVLEHIYDPQKVLYEFSRFLKDDGFFVISLPNVAHASIKALLLDDMWEYTDVGLLDKTHIRFFTHKTIPTFLAEIGLGISKVYCTVSGKYGTNPTSGWGRLSYNIRKFILSNPHSYVVQYVMLVKKVQGSYFSVLTSNRSLIDSSVFDVPKTESLFWYLKNKLLSKITFGKTRKYYKAKFK